MAAEPGSERSPWRRRLVVAALLALALIAVLVALASRGGVEAYDRGERGAPGWTAPCWRGAPREDRRLLARCSRVKGTVLWVRREGTGEQAKAHLVVVSGFEVMLARFSAPVPRDLPGIASSVTAVGPLVRARNGMREVQVFGIC